MFRKLQQITIALTSVCTTPLFCDPPPIMGLIGGVDESSTADLQYAATVSPFGEVTRLNLGQRDIDSVALNGSGLGLIGGTGEQFKFFAAFVSSDKGIQQVPFPGIFTFLTPVKVAINEAGLGLIGGRATNLAYAAFVTPNSVTQISIPILSPSGEISAVALNNSNVGIIGGRKQPAIGPAYAGLVYPNVATAQDLTLNLSDGNISNVDINDSGIGLIGGAYRSNIVLFPYVAYVINGNVLPITIPSNFLGSVQGIALNESNVGLVGAGNFIAFVYPNQTYQQLIGVEGAAIFNVSINDAGYGLIGGRVGNFPNVKMYAALVNPDAKVLSLSGLPAGTIREVSINVFNQGLIGGQTATAVPYVAIVSSSGVVTPLNLGLEAGDITGVAINAFFLSQLPTGGLHGNNLRFAEYINTYAPQDVFYFVPALVEGSFANALQSAAPTRNAISFYTGLQNAFYFTTAFSTHLREQRSIHSRPFSAKSNSTAQLESAEEPEEEFLASRCFPDAKKTRERERGKRQKECLSSDTVWLEAVGALAYQSSQHQTPAFNPSSGGAILGYDGAVTKEFTVGGGATYLYTHIHEKQDEGSAHLNQEDLFFYGSWNPKHFYLDLGVWGGLFQTHQDRHIHMPGFSFHSISKPKGWQLTPHMELGWIGEIKRTQKVAVDWTLLGMLDWAHAWQRKYKEKGSGPFNVQQNSHHGSLLRTEAGFRFSETFYYSCWNLSLQEKGSYVNVQSFNAGTVKGFIVASPGFFTLETLNKMQNLGVVQFLISGASYKKWHPTGTLFYQGEFGSSYQSHQLGLEFAMSF